MLGFQTETAAFSIRMSVFAGLRRNHITCIQLNAGLCRHDGHPDTGARADCGRHLFQFRRGVKYKIMVISGAVMQLFIVCADILSNRFGIAEVKGVPSTGIIFSMVRPLLSTAV